jgi:hypothetical protein
MLALADWEANRCHICGGNLDECWDPASEGRWAVPPPMRCYRGTAIAKTRKGYEDNPVNAPHQALMFWAVRKETR